MRENTLLGRINSSLAFEQPGRQCFSQLLPLVGASGDRSLPVFHCETPAFMANVHSCGAPGRLLVWYQMPKPYRPALSKSYRTRKSQSWDTNLGSGKHGIAG